MKRRVLVLIGVVAIALNAGLVSPAVAQFADLNRQTVEAERRQAGNGQSQNPQEVPFTPGPAATGERAGQSREPAGGVRETISGLRDAGYTLDIIVGFLKNSGCQAHEVSMSCLHAGYRGADIVDALKKAGFEDRVAEDAVPRTLRGGKQTDFVLSEQEMAGIANAVMSAAAQGNNMVPLAIGQQAVLSQSRFLRPADAAPAETIAPGAQAEGGAFNGLGNWNRFQHERAKDFEHK